MAEGEDVEAWQRRRAVNLLVADVVDALARDLRASAVATINAQLSDGTLIKDIDAAIAHSAAKLERRGVPLTADNLQAFALASLMLVHADRIAGQFHTQAAEIRKAAE